MGIIVPYQYTVMVPLPSSNKVVSLTLCLLTKGLCTISMRESHRTEDLASWCGRMVTRGLTDWDTPTTEVRASTAYGVQHRMKEQARSRTCTEL